MITFSLQKGCLILRLRAQKNDLAKGRFSMVVTCR